MKRIVEWWEFGFYWLLHWEDIKEAKQVDGIEFSKA